MHRVVCIYSYDLICKIDALIHRKYCGAEYHKNIIINRNINDNNLELTIYIMFTTHTSHIS